MTKRRKTLYARLVQQIKQRTDLSWPQRRAVYAAVRKALALQDRADGYPRRPT